jgi:hypothetical protein
MRLHTSDSGFTLIELMIASTITMVIMGVAFTSFKDALAINETVAQMTDAGQNLRAGTNLLVRDLLQAGRNIPADGIPIPSNGATTLYRPSPPGSSLSFDNTTQTTLSAVTTGYQLGPTVAGRKTDVITIMMSDSTLVDPATGADLGLFQAGAPSGYPKIAADGASFDVGSHTAWLQGSVTDDVPKIKAGDLLLFTGQGNNALQTVTSVSGSSVLFAASDPFGFNQRGATLAGTVMNTLPLTPWNAGPPASPAAVTVKRVLMISYYVHTDSEGAPRLMRMMGHFEPQALAGIVEDLAFTYDLFDGDKNPVALTSLPKYVNASLSYSANQIRKVNLQVGVRSELKSARTKDFLRSHLSTVVSLRNLAFADRYK